MLEYLKLIKYIFIKKLDCPIQLIHFVTSKCNSKCQHCFYWEKLNRNNDLTLEEIEKITKTLPDLRFLAISGGEPFLRKDFSDIIKLYYRNTSIIKVDIPTNGILTEKIKEDCIEILESCPKLELNISISLEGKEKVHNKIRGVKCYNDAIKTIYEIKYLQKKYKQLKLSIGSTLMSENQEDILNFSRYVKKELKPNFFTLNLIRYNPKHTGLKDVNLSYFIETEKFDSEEKVKGLKNNIRKIMNKIRTHIIVNQKYYSRCYAGILIGVLSENGDVFPCEGLNNYNLNIRDYDYNFINVWKSEKMEKYREFIKRSKCFCTHECFLRINILFNPIYFIKGIINLNLYSHKKIKKRMENLRKNNKIKN